MKKKGFVLVYMTIVALALFMMASCGNSKKNQTQNNQAMGQMDTVTVIESETVIIAVDSVAPDSMAMKKKTVTPKTK